MNTQNNWYLTSKYAIYVTWAFEGANSSTGCGCYPDGSLPKSFNEMADAFDVSSFAEDCAEMGVQYVNFTAYHANLFILYPSKVVEAVLPGHTCRRDVIMELADALHEKGIRLQLYIHATVGDTMTEEDREKTGWHDAAGGYKRWNDFFNDFFGEMALRYGTKIDSYYLDMIFDKPFLDMIDRKRLRDTLRSHHPNVVIVGNGEANELVDYGSREDAMERHDDENKRVAFPTQTVVCISNWWWAVNPDTVGSVAKYSPEHLFRYMVITAAANSCGGGLAIGASPYVTRGFEPGVKETLAAVGRLVEPVAESIKNTLPSPAFFTPPGATIETLPQGVAATRSACGKYEYLHLLRQPEGDALRLAPPLDGSRYGRAALLPEGTEVPLAQDKNGLTLTLPGEWSYPDTVIKLWREDVSAAGEVKSRTLPQSELKATAEALPGHGAELALDGDPATFWLTEGGRLHPITLDLGTEHRVIGLRVLPRQDGNGSAQLTSHICTYSVQVSLDGEAFYPVAGGEWPRSLAEKQVRFSPQQARFVRLIAGPDWLPESYWGAPGAAGAAEIQVEVAAD